MCSSCIVGINCISCGKEQVSPYNGFVKVCVGLEQGQSDHDQSFFFINGVFETKPIKYITQTFVKTRTTLLLFIFYLIHNKVELKQEIDNVNGNKMKSV